MTFKGGLTRLEARIIEIYYGKYKDINFPNADSVFLGCRENTGAGRYTYVFHDGIIRMDDGILYPGNYSQIDVASLEFGLMYSVCVERGKLIYIEMVANGDGGWDGSEDGWKIADPTTGL